MDCLLMILNVEELSENSIKKLNNIMLKMKNLCTKIGILISV